MENNLKELNLWLELDGWIDQNQHVQDNKFLSAYLKSSSYFLKKIPQAFLEAFNDFFSTAIFHSQSFLQSSRQFQEKKSDILHRAQILRGNVTTISDLRQLPIRQLNFLAEQEISKALIISSVQGGVSGTSSKLTLICDLPTLLLVNLKAVQEVALCYGYDVSKPMEMECALKVLQAALLPAPEKYKMWKNIMNDILKHDDEDVFASWNYDLKGEDLHQTILLQFSKLFIVHSLKKRLIGGVPLLGITIGAKWNELITKNILDFTKSFYQYRLLSKRLKKGPTV